MREKKRYRVFTFHSTTQAMMFEKQCAVMGIPGRIIPTPREISASCGLSWRMPAEDYPSCRELLTGDTLSFASEAELWL